MLRELKKVIEESGKDAQEFQQTANFLLANQFVSAFKHGQRKHYLLVESYNDYFANLFDALGMKLYVNENERLAGVLPIQREAFVRLKTDETLFLLVLRQIYEEKIENFEVDNGFVATNTHTILDRYVQLVKRDIPNETRFKDILALFSRHGVIIRGKTYEEDSKNMIINVTPVVRLIVTEAYLRQLESFNGADPDEDDIERDPADNTDSDKAEQHHAEADKVGTDDRDDQQEAPPSEPATSTPGDDDTQQATIKED